MLKDGPIFPNGGEDETSAVGTGADGEHSADILENDDQMRQMKTIG